MKRLIALSLAAGLLTGCSTPEPEPLPPMEPLPPQGQLQYRPTDALPDQINSDIITVQQFRSVCDRMARSLIIQPFATNAKKPPVITIRKLQNKTGLKLDAQIFQETIRVKLMEHAGGTVLFRDDASYQDILEERMRQGENEINISLTESKVQTRKINRGRERSFVSGSLSGLSNKSATEGTEEEESKMEMSQEGTVKSKVAAADYFLRGIIFQMKEHSATDRTHGMNYFQYQFRLTDARNGLIVWEKMLDSKMQGLYTPVIAPPPPPVATNTPPNKTGTSTNALPGGTQTNKPPTTSGPGGIGTTTWGTPGTPPPKR